MTAALHALRLCLVTQSITLESWPLYSQLIRQAIAGQITSVQLRLKQPSQAQTLALRCKALLDPFNIPLIINDDVALAKAIDAAGVHLGQEDCCPCEARAILGEKKIIGLSIETLEQLERANKMTTIDYVAASAIFPSKSKKNCRTFWGMKGLKQFTAQAKHPTVAIGGINETNVEEVILAGAAGVAVIGAIHDAKKPEYAAKILWGKIYSCTPQ